MRAVYIDTEFTQLNMTRQLISLALVDTSDFEFYVEITDTWLENECSDCKVYFFDEWVSVLA